MRTFNYKPVILDDVRIVVTINQEQMRTFSEYKPVVLDAEVWEGGSNVQAEARIQADAMILKAEAKVENPAPSPLAELPPWAPFLLACVAKPGREDEILGDAESVYRQMIARLGVTRARWYYGVYVLKLAGRMLPSVAMRILLIHKLIGHLGF
jgi:hypothetical protein